MSAVLEQEEEEEEDGQGSGTTKLFSKAKGATQCTGVKPWGSKGRLATGHPEDQQGSVILQLLFNVVSLKTTEVDRRWLAHTRP